MPKFTQLLCQRAQRKGLCPGSLVPQDVTLGCTQPVNGADSALLTASQTRIARDRQPLRLRKPWWSWPRRCLPRSPCQLSFLKAKLLIVTVLQERKPLAHWEAVRGPQRFPQPLLDMGGNWGISRGPRGKENEDECETAQHDVSRTGWQGQTLESDQRGQ